MRILVADDHSIVRKGLVQIVKEMPEILEVDEAENGKQVFEKVENTKYDAVVLDISMPDKNGLDILKELKVSHPELRVLILSVYPENLYAIRSLRAGASGYITKSSAPEELAEALRRITKGGKYISASLAETLADRTGADQSKLPHEMLSDREFQVMQHLAAGKTYSEIADELFLSEKTVSTYRSRILGKMNLKNNSEIILYAVKNNLIN